VYWNKAKIDQMSDRIHRIGQTQDVYIYNLLTENSIEMKLLELIEKKDIICRVIVDGMKVTNDVTSWLNRVIKLLD
jgi:SNF2 family DNA or RNA helicase